MLVELNRSPVAEGMAAVNAAIVELLEAIAGASDYADAIAGWGYSLPSEADVGALLALDASARRQLVEAARTDMEFDPRQGDHEFAYPRLDPAIREAAKPLLVWMYNSVFKRGRGFVLTAELAANRSSWEAAFREANPDLHVCPACLSADLLERIGGRSSVDLDHYLPKAVYPALSVHGLNLVPICHLCNSNAKREADPLADGGERLHLSAIWFPYGEPGLDHAHLVFEPAKPLPRLVRLQADDSADERARRFEELFLLGQRWSRELEGIHDSTCELLVDFEVATEAAAVREKLLRLHQRNEAKRTARPKAFLTAAYVRWLAETDVVLDALVASLRADA